LNSNEITTANPIFCGLPLQIERTLPRSIRLSPIELDILRISGLFPISSSD
jgi:hypothetical protein